MNDALFIEWCSYFVEDVSHMRGDPNYWCLLVLDSHSSHTMIPKALQALNNNRILAIFLPSHTSSILQMHDVSIFGPLKRYFRSSLSSYLRTNPSIKFEDRPVILEEPWALANNSLNIRKGFSKVGIYPLNRD